MTSSPITTAYLDLAPDIRSRAEQIAGNNRPVTWPEVLLLVGTAIAGERERCAGLATGWLDNFCDSKITSIPADVFASDAVRDIRDSILGLSEGT